MLRGLAVSPAVSCDAAKKSTDEPTTEEMQARMQNLIDLQYAAASCDAAGEAETTTGTVDAPIIPGASPAPAPPPPPSAASSSTGAGGGFLSASGEEGVGQGQLLFPSDYPRAPPLGGDHPTLYANYGAAGGAGIQPPPPQHMGSSLSAEDDQNVGRYHSAGDYHDPLSSPFRNESSSCCCCLDWLFHCAESLVEAEPLHRSFCYGAIDGMLTGSGIVAAFSGMRVLTHFSSLATRWFVVGFCLSACVADAVCMALGHVWNTYVMTLASAVERRTERVSFEQHRSDAKGKLVDMLLSRGMLKIDAMSIADTLEGYPDIFISALVGDSGYALGDEPLKPSNVALGKRAQRSYGSFNEWEYDPESAAVAQNISESRTEGIIMMISFAMFSVIPALTHLVLSEMIQPQGGTSVSVPSLTMSTISFIMLFLGIWKSTFFDSNWIMFGIETVLVLFLCVFSAYGLGAALWMLLPSDCLFGKVLPNGTCKLQGE